eukprot:5330225-Pyramimonas_sp.AAC.1
MVQVNVCRSRFVGGCGQGTSARLDDQSGQHPVVGTWRLTKIHTSRCSGSTVDRPRRRQTQ